GKHTLVEKPLALNAAQATEIAQLAADRGRFCAEALWTFFLPKFDIVRQLLDDGALGEVRTVQADHGEHFTAEHRILRADLAGGPLLDLGTHPVSLATWGLGPPPRVGAAGQPPPAAMPRPHAPLTLPGPFYQPGDLLLASADGDRQLRFTEPRAAHDALHFE